MKALRKIDLMHQLFGKKTMYKCKECNNLCSFRYRTKSLRKCKVYGITSSEASDWAYKYEACGMFNKEWNGNPIINLVKHSSKNKKEEEPPIDGQISL